MKPLQRNITRGRHAAAPQKLSIRMPILAKLGAALVTVALSLVGNGIWAQWTSSGAPNQVSQTVVVNQTVVVHEVTVLLDCASLSEVVSADQ